jgi:hypothetical protein
MVDYPPPQYHESIKGRAVKALDMLSQQGFELCDDFLKDEQTEDGLGPVNQGEVCYWKDGYPAMFVDPITQSILRYLLKNKLLAIRVGPYPNNEHHLMRYYEPTERGNEWLQQQKANLID